MGFSGRLEGIVPSDIFQIISQNRMTGTLIARCPDGTAMIVFKEGQVVEAASDAPQESLGHLLVSQGLMSEQTMETARERWKMEPERPLGAILVEMGAIAEKTLETEVRKQIGQIVHRLMSCDDGFITFDRGEGAVKRKLHTGEFFLASGVSPEFLLMERARVIDEERRSGADRRRFQAVGASPGAGPAGEQRRATDAHAGTRAASFPDRPLSWFRGIRLPKVSDTMVQEAKDLFGSVADLVGLTILHWFRTVRSRASAFSPDGKVLIYAGICGIATGIGLILLFSLSSQTTGGDLVITGRIVKLRSGPTTSAEVVTKISQGEIVSPVEFKNDWHQVKTKAGETGWVWKNLVEQQEKKKKSWVFRYRVTGSELLLLSGIALLVEGIRRKRRAVTAPPVVLRQSG